MAVRFVPRLFFNSWLHRWQIRKAGRKDGASGNPDAEDQSTSFYEEGLLDQGRQLLNDIQRTSVKKRQKIEAEHNETVDQFKRAVSEYVDTRTAFEGKRRQLGRGVVVHVPRGVYFFILSGLALGELALNLGAFEIFQKPQLFTFIMALIVAVGLPASAHFTGLWLKQWPPYRDENGKTGKFWRACALFATALVAALACFYGLNVARSEYMKLVDPEQIDRESIIFEAFYMINAFVYVAAATLSYWAHDHDQEFENLHNRLFRLDQLCRSLNRRIADLAGRHDDVVTAEETDFRAVKAIVAEVVNLYRRENQRSRPDAKQRPKAFAGRPDLEDPEPVKEGQRMLSADEVEAIRQAWTRIRETPAVAAAAGAQT